MDSTGEWLLGLLRFEIFKSSETEEFDLLFGLRFLKFSEVQRFIRRWVYAELCFFVYDLEVEIFGAFFGKQNFCVLIWLLLLFLLLQVLFHGTLPFNFFVFKILFEVYFGGVLTLLRRVLVLLLIVRLLLVLLLGLRKAWWRFIMDKVIKGECLSFRLLIGEIQLFPVRYWTVGPGKLFSLFFTGRFVLRLPKIFFYNSTKSLLRVSFSTIQY